jgi:site-specific DNA recombinase
MLTAAIYARKSNDQNVADADAKSVARQIENARAFAKTKGWTVDERHIYSDDAISGAETTKLRQRQRLLDVIAKRPPFQALIVRDGSRFSRRDGDEAFSELKAIARAGVQVFYYHDGSRFTYGDMGSNVAAFVGAEMNAEFRRSIARWVTEAMVRKARAGHVTGGRTFGYDNVKVGGHVERRINDTQAAIVRRIFELSAKGMGYHRIAHALNVDCAPTPRPTAAKSTGWNGAGVSHVLHRPIYRGQIIWNRSKRRDAEGKVNVHARPASDWVTLDRPDLRIVSDELWQRVQRRLTGVRDEYDRLNARRPYRRDQDSAYLLTGFARCALCGAGLHVRGRRRADGRRVCLYACTSRYHKGPAACAHSEQWLMDDLDRAVLDTIVGTIDATDIATIVRVAREDYAAVTTGDRGKQLERALATVTAQQARLTEAIASGAGQIAPLVERLQTTEAKRRSLSAELEQARQTRPAPVWRDVERLLRNGLKDWRSRLLGDVETARAAFRELLTSPIRCTPVVEQGYRAIAFEGRLSQCLFAGAEVTNQQSPRDSSIGYQPDFRGIWRSTRRAA